MKKILIVEDNDNNRRLIRDILKYHGFDILEAENGAEGVDLAIKHKPDLILMDIQMPVMDGNEANRLIKADPGTKGIKIIAVTSFAMKGDREKFLEAGFIDYISKPIDTRKLPEIVNRHLEG